MLIAVVITHFSVVFAMLCLQFFSCTVCETVYADVEEPPTCDVCEGGQFEKLEAGRQAMSYFAHPPRDSSRM